MLLRVHHIVPVSLGGTDEIENLVLLCPNCHTLVHLLSSKRFSGRDASSILVSEYEQEATNEECYEHQQILRRVNSI